MGSLKVNLAIVGFTDSQINVSAYLTAMAALSLSTSASTLVS